MARQRADFDAKKWLKMLASPVKTQTYLGVPFSSTQLALACEKRMRILSIEWVGSFERRRFLCQYLPNSFEEQHCRDRFSQVRQVGGAHVNLHISQKEEKEGGTQIQVYYCCTLVWFTFSIHLRQQTLCDCFPNNTKAQTKHLGPRCPILT